MNDGITNYLNISKSNLNIIISNLESNIEFLDNELWDNYEEIKSDIENIINIYYDKYYLYVLNDYSRIEKYIKFNNKINYKLKNILLAIIDYYESVNSEDIIRLKESSILYLNILIYVSLVLYEKKFNSIDNPKKIEKVINNIIDNFARIRFKKEKDLVTLISNIKELVEKNNYFNNEIDNLEDKSSYNTYIKINKDMNAYKVIYEYNIKELNKYDERDINIVNKEKNVKDLFTLLSYDLCYYTMFKVMKNNKNMQFLFPIGKKELMNEELRKKISNRNCNILQNIKLVVNYDDIKNDYEFINMMNEENIDIYLEVFNSYETNNYNMFMNVKNVIVNEDFISINEKYLEIWKDMGINFIIKNLGDKLFENNLIRK